MKLYWIGYDGKEVFYTEVGALAEARQPTFVGHSWMVRNQNGEIVFKPFAIGDGDTQTLSIGSSRGRRGAPLLTSRPLADEAKTTLQAGHYSVKSQQECLSEFCMRIDSVDIGRAESRASSTGGPRNLNGGNFTRVNLWFRGQRDANLDAPAEEEIFLVDDVGTRYPLQEHTGSLLLR